jgi:hypothetical protein
VRSLLLAMPDPDAEVACRRVLCRAAWRDGYACGLAAGRRQEAAERDALWAAAAGPIARGGAPAAELELRRWGPGGREHFGDPRPGDYLGREARHAG